MAATTFFGGDFFGGEFFNNVAVVVLGGKGDNGKRSKRKSIIKPTGLVYADKKKTPKTVVTPDEIEIQGEVVLARAEPEKLPVPVVTMTDIQPVTKAVVKKVNDDEEMMLLILMASQA